MTQERRNLYGARVPQALAEVRSSPDGQPQAFGYAAVFNRYSQNLGGFVEEVDPVAFNRTLRVADVMGLFNHDMNQVLGRNVAGTMTLETDNIGLSYLIDMPNTTAARDVVENIKLRNVTGSSFSFRTSENGDTWGYTEQGFPLRRLIDVELFDVGPVTFPAYLDTQADDAAVALRSLADRTHRSLKDVIEAAKANELRTLLETSTEIPDPPMAEEERSVETTEEAAPASTSRPLAYYRHMAALRGLEAPAAR